MLVSFVSIDCAVPVPFLNKVVLSRSKFRYPLKILPISDINVYSTANIQQVMGPENINSYL